MVVVALSADHTLPVLGCVQCGTRLALSGKQAKVSVVIVILIIKRTQHRIERTASAERKQVRLMIKMDASEDPDKADKVCACARPSVPPRGEYVA